MNISLIADEEKLAQRMHDSELVRNVDEVAAVFARSGSRAALLKDAEMRERYHALSHRTGKIRSGFISAPSIATQYALVEDRETTLI
jgi:hypothetical protein